MSRLRSLLQFLAVCAAGTLLNASSPTANLAADNSRPRLTAISTRSTLKGTSLIIEASDSVAYVAMRPDPMTVVVELRNTSAEKVATSSARARVPIATVSVEPLESAAGPGSRVRIALTQPVAHHVRSVRSFVIIDFDKSPDGAAAGLLDNQPPMAAPTPAASTIAGPNAAATAAPGSAAGGPSAAPPESPVMDRAVARATVDPIAALGLNNTSSGPRAQPAGSSAQATTPTVQTTQPATFGTGQPNERKYSGHPVSLDFQGADLRAVLRTFAEISGLNIVIDPAVQGSVDVSLRDVPWDQALDIILRANKLGYLLDGTIVRIAPLNVLAEEETQHRKLADEQALSGLLRVMTKTPSYAKATELQPLLTLPLLLLPLVALKRRMVLPLLCVVTLLAGNAMYPFFFPHYAAPLCGAMILLIVCGMRHLRAWRCRQGRAGRRGALAPVVDRAPRPGRGAGRPRGLLPRARHRAWPPHDPDHGRHAPLPGGPRNLCVS
jgi:hypothetical protein